MNRRIFLLILGVAAAGLIAFALSSGKLGTQGSNSSAKVKITASFYPMAEFARQVGGSRVEVSTLIGPGVEPHDYDPAPKDLVAVQRSKVFVYNGAGLEPWADKVKGDLQSKG